ncbi:aromatic amino acid lyase, partial [Tianweitania sp.]|uniref:aromatic amino acid lyase n=1 Tax=Tianweitania sp. TaxID=2021634 RepID=UPI00289CA668
MTPAAFVLGERRLTLADITAAARKPVQIALDAGVRERMIAARSVVDRHLRDGIAVYGLNTGLGGNIGHRIDQDAVADFQAQMVRARVAG